MGGVTRGFNKKIYKIIAIIILHALITTNFPPAYADWNTSADKTTLAPRLNLNSLQFQNIYKASARPLLLPMYGFQEKGPFIMAPATSGQRDIFFDQQLQSLNKLNESEGQEAVFEYILNEPELLRKISLLIRTQERKGDTNGYAVEWQWAEAFKHEALKRAVEVLKGRDIFFLQMEYELSFKFLEEFEKHLKNIYGLTEEEAKYATGQMAKLLMAGGLGSFKPDLVRAFYDVLKIFWGELEARNRLHVLGVLYSQAIKGEGELAKDEKLNAIVEKIRHYEEKYSNQKYKEQSRRNGVHPLVEILTKSLDSEATYYDIEVNMNNIGKVDVVVYRNPFSDLHEYWMFCPQIFQEVYPGHPNDEFRAVQAYVYREVLLRHVKFLAEKGRIGNKIIISASETSTALANPLAADRDLSRYPKEQREMYQWIFDFLSGVEIDSHHYTHAPLKETMGNPPQHKFGQTKISPEFASVAKGNDLDLRLLTGEVFDYITGCGSLHTQVSREDIYREFADKVIENDLFGNSEGSDVERWQGEEIKTVIAKYMRKTKTQSYAEFFRKLAADTKNKYKFFYEMREAKKIQKQRFINELFKGTFGDIGLSMAELQKMEKKNNLKPLIERPVFSFVRRFARYKCADKIVDWLYAHKEDIIRSGAMVILGGRKFDDFGPLQLQRIEELIAGEPRLKAQILFLSNHNVANSWMIQQGTDFGGMLSYEKTEAGPTSPFNAGLNWTNLFAVLDGVLVERLMPVKKNGSDKVISGTGYIVKYSDEFAPGTEYRLPDMESFNEEFLAASESYYKHKDYDEVAFNNLWMNMTQGDIRTQASGLIMVMAEQRKKKECTCALNGKIIKTVADSLMPELASKILYDAESFGINKFGFKGAPFKESPRAGLYEFLETLRNNHKRGYVYGNSWDFVNYIESLLDKAGVQEKEKFLALLKETAGSNKTEFGKQKKFIEILSMFKEALQAKTKGENYNIPYAEVLSTPRCDELRKFFESQNVLDLTEQAI